VQRRLVPKRTDAFWHGDIEYVIRRLDGQVGKESTTARISRRFWSSMQRSLSSLQDPGLILNRHGNVWGDDVDTRPYAGSSPDVMWIGPSIWFISNGKDDMSTEAEIVAHLEKMARVMTSGIRNGSSAAMLWGMYAGWVHSHGVTRHATDDGGPILHARMLEANAILKLMPAAQHARDRASGAAVHLSSSNISVLHTHRLAESAVDECDLPKHALLGPHLHWTMHFHYTLLDIMYAQFCGGV
jgi:hypothetical protein